MKTGLSAAFRTMGVLWILASGCALFAQSGITFVDIKKQGTNPDSTYTGDTTTAELRLTIKDKDGHPITALIQVEFTKGKTYSQMAAALAAKINQAVADNEWQAEATVSDNSVTVTCVVYELDGDTEETYNSSDDFNDPYFSKRTRKVPKKK